MKTPSPPFSRAKNSKIYHSYRHTNRGNSFIEVLVSMLIFSIAVLSITGAHAVVKKNDIDALQRTIASQIAEETAKNMRVNSAALASYLTESTGIGASSLNQTSCTAESPCTPEQIAANDLAHLVETLKGSNSRIETSQDIEGVTVVSSRSTGGLLDAVACISGPANGGNGLYSIAIAWRGITALKNPANHSCGASSDNYGNNNELRRLVFLELFIG